MFSSPLFSKQKALTIWLTGLSGAGKSTIAEALFEKISELGLVSCILDGDQLRNGLNQDLGFSESDRMENIRRVAEVSKILNEQGIISINAFISPTESIRKKAKEIISAEKFFLVFLNAPLDVCEKRDKKGLYSKARRGDVKNFTGISSIFETPVISDLELDTANQNIDQCVEKLLKSILPRIK